MPKPPLSEQELAANLLAKKSELRRRAAKEIGQRGLKSLSEPLLEAYRVERRDSRTWETQVAMITALGLLDVKEALLDLEVIVKRDELTDAITTAAASAYVRLKRRERNDASLVIELLKSSGYAVICGALGALGDDRMIPPDEQIEELIALAFDLHQEPTLVAHFPRLDDPRRGIARACPGWPPALTQKFLKHCIATQPKDTGLVYACEQALKGKYAKL